MSDDPSKRRLGRGLAALIGELDAQQPVKAAESSNTANVAPSDTRMAPIETVRRNPANPRKVFAEAELAELSDSIKAHGIVQPVVVRPAPGVPGQYEIIAGERRWRAAQKAGLDTIPIVVRDVDDRLALELAIIENVQRADLNPVEEAQGYQQLIDHYAYSQNDLAQVIAKSRSHVANTLRLLKLPEPVLAMISDGRLSAGHARTIITAENPEALADRIIRQGLSVREAEALAQAGGAPRPKPAQSEKDADTKALERRLSDLTGLGVEIAHKARGGTLTIRYKTLEQLDDLIAKLGS